MDKTKELIRDSIASFLVVTGTCVLLLIAYNATKLLESCL